jgi:hypothetical protein
LKAIENKDWIIHPRRLNKSESKNYHPCQAFETNQNQRIIIHPRRLKKIGIKDPPDLAISNPWKNRRVSGKNWQGTHPSGVWGGFSGQLFDVYPNQYFYILPIWYRFLNPRTRGFFFFPFFFGPPCFHLWLIVKKTV